MAEQWFYQVDDQQLGPVSAAQLKELASNGQLRKGDMVRKEDMPNWGRADSVKGLFGSASPPPLPPSVEQTEIPVAQPAIDNPPTPPIAINLALKPHHMTWAYRGAMAVLLIATLCPWITAEGSASTRYGDLGRDMNGMGLGQYGNDYQQMGNQSASLQVSVDGISTLWGKAILLLVIAGAALSFVGPAKLIPEGKQFFAKQEKVIMAAVGGLCCLLLLIVLMTVASYVNEDANVQSRYASSSSTASVAWGWYIAFLGGIGATVLGFLVPWQSKPETTAGGLS